MHIVSLLGSPRANGNSSAIARRFGQVAQGLGAEVQTFTLNELQFRGCQGCRLCKTRLDWCKLEDELTTVLAAIREADTLLLASPIYYGDVSSQLKAFIDRTYSFLVPDYTTNPKPHRLAPGKRLVFVLSQGDPDEQHHADVFPRYESFFRWYGMRESHLIRVCGVSRPGEAEARDEVMQRAEMLATKLCS